MKIISKKDALILSVIAVVLIIIILIADPTPLIKWRAKHHSAALSQGIKKPDTAQWKCFFDLRKLKNYRKHINDLSDNMVVEYVVIV